MFSTYAATLPLLSAHENERPVPLSAFCLIDTMLAYVPATVKKAVASKRMTLMAAMAQTLGLDVLILGLLM